MFTGDRWQHLADQSAKHQRLLWASDSSKDPSVKDPKYVESLIGADTVDTATMEIIDAFRDHGVVNATLESELDSAANLLRLLRNLGIDLEKVS